jgi:hypothetical protein
MRSVFRMAAAFVGVVVAISLGACAPANDARPGNAAVAPGSERPIDPQGWTITAPAAGATNAVRVAFPAPLEPDVLSALGVLTADGTPLPGDMFAGQDRRMWQFTPRAAWPAGNYHLAAFGKAMIPFTVR